MKGKRDFKMKKNKLKPNDKQNSSEDIDFFEKKGKKPPSVLIIDDEVDSILPVASLFQKLGCNIICITDFDEAVKSISGFEADIIVLDWMLDERNGGEVLLDSIKKMKMKKLKSKEEKETPPELKCIIYSGKKKEEIKLPKTNLFNYVEHWEKPLSYDQLLSNMKIILNGV